MIIKKISVFSIYGILICDGTLEEVYQIVRFCLKCNESEVYIYKSQFNGEESLKISTTIYDFYTEKISEIGEHVFNGEIEGEKIEVINIIKLLANNLSKAGYKYQFEIYDDHDNKMELIYEFSNIK